MSAPPTPRARGALLMLSMGALAGAHLVRAGIERVHVVNRSLPRARRLAEREEAGHATAR